MKKTILICFVLSIILTGCQQSNKVNDIKVISDDSLKSGLKTLLDEDSYSLEIQYNGGRFIKANEYFAYRLLQLLSNDLEPEWKDRTIDNYQIALKFEDYKEIHINTDSEIFYFKGEEEIYSAKGFKDLWERYIIKLIDDEPTYCEFEKTVFTEINRDINGDEKIDDVLLFYDGDIRLRVNDTELVLDKAQYLGPTFMSGKQYYSHSPLDSVNLEYIEELDLLMYTVESFSIRGPFTNISFYKYKNGMINKIWSNFDINCQLKKIDFDKGTIDISFPFANRNYETNLNNEELKRSQLIISELKTAGVKIDDKYIDNIKENIISSANHVLFKDYDSDGTLELILLGRIHTVGASTPIYLEDRIIFIFDLFSDSIECTDILFERDLDNTNNLFNDFM